MPSSLDTDAMRAGQQINDIDNYNHVCEEMKSFKSEEVRNLDDIQEGCLTRYDSRINRLFAYTIEGHDAVATAGANQRGVVLPKLTRINTTGIEQGKFVRMGHKPCLWFRSIWILSAYSLLPT